MKYLWIVILALMSVSCSTQAQMNRIFMTGDSHVAGKIYPEKVREILLQRDPEIEFSFFGKNGAGFYTYNETPEFMDTMFSFEPEILIVHLGTNDSYSKVFYEDKFLSDVDTFYKNIRKKLPSARIVFITPFENMLKEKNGKRSYNDNTRLCADVLIKFSNDKPDVFVVDNNMTAGKGYVDNPKYIRPDMVHLTVEGYEDLGQSVASALLSIPELWDIEETDSISFE